MKKFSILLCFALFCAVIFSGNIYAQTVTYDGIPDLSLGELHPNDYVLYKDYNGTFRVIAFHASEDNVEKPIVRFITDENYSRISIESLVKGSYSMYVLNNVSGVGLMWIKEQNTSFSVGANVSKLINSAVSEFVKTSSEIVISDGTVVFPEPPTPTLTQVIQEETTKAQGTILKAMTVIALCGVGCLALLTVLPILSRVFSRYR